MKLGVERHAFLVHLGELAGEHDPQFGAHFVAEPGIALGLAGLALERVHLPRDFFKDVVDAVEIGFCVFQARLRQTLPGFEFRNARRFFNNVAPVGGTAAQNLSDAPLFDERVRFRPQPRPHEQFLDVAQAAQFAIQQVFAVAAAEQAARHRNLSGVVLLLIEFAAADFQNYQRSSRCHCDRGGIRRRFVRGCFGGRGSGRNLALNLFGLSRLCFLDGTFRFRGRLGADFRFIPIFCAVHFRRRKLVLNLNLGGRVRIRPSVNFRINQSQGNFGHSGGIAVAGAGEDHVFHARAAQRLGRLLAQHPGDRVGDVRLAAAVRPDDGGDAFAMEFQFGAIAERLEPQDLQLLEFEQNDSFVGGHVGPRTRFALAGVRCKSRGTGC